LLTLRTRRGAATTLATIALAISVALVWGACRGAISARLLVMNAATTCPVAPGLRRILARREVPLRIARMAGVGIPLRTAIAVRPFTVTPAITRCTASMAALPAPRCMTISVRPVTMAWVAARRVAGASGISVTRCMAMAIRPLAVTRAIARLISRTTRIPVTRRMSAPGAEMVLVRTRG